MIEPSRNVWMALAGEHLALVNRLVAEGPALAPMIAHYAQMAGEQALKALLVARGVRPRRTRDMGALLREVCENGVVLGEQEDACQRLNQYVGLTLTPNDEIEVSALQAGVARDDAQRLVDAAELALSYLGPAPTRSPESLPADDQPRAGATDLEVGLDTPISEVVAAVVAAADPVRVILFGSRAGGQPDHDSDIDLMVEIDRDVPRRQESVRIRIAISPRDYSLDLLVYTPAMIAKQRGVYSSFLSEIEETGRVMYERAPGREPRAGGS